MGKKIPLRMCIACREMKPKSELIRIVKNGEEIHLDATGKMNGRGAYICNKDDCIAKLKKQRLINRAFSCEVSDEVYDIIAEEYGKEHE